MTIKNRTDLKLFFVKNAIPTEGNFADLIDSQLNQAQDGVFKPDNEALSVVAAPGDQKRVLRLYASYPAPNPDWMIALNPAQDPAVAGSSRAGLGVTDGVGKTKLFLDAATGRIGVGTNVPQVALDVVGSVQANGFRGRYDLVLADYRTVNPASNVCLQSPGNDRDTWIYRDTADSGSNWGIYHRQMDSAIAGLPANSIGFVGGGASKLQAYVNLGTGSGFFAGGLSIQGLTDMSATTTTWGGWLEALRFSRTEHSAITHPGGKLLFGMHSDRNFYFADTDAGRHLAVISPANGGSLGVGTNGPPERPFHVHSSLADWQAHFQNDSSGVNVYLAHGGGYGMHVRADTAATGNYLLQLYNQTLGGSLFLVNTNGDTSITRSLTVSGVINGTAGLMFEGAVAHIDRDGAIYRNTDGQCYITVDDFLRLRRSGTGANWTVQFDTNAGNLQLRGVITAANKLFRIDHPLDPERDLVHSVLEGPEAAVFYRGEAALVNGACEIELPSYFEALTRKDSRTVQLTPKLTEGEETSALAAGAVANGRFIVRGIDPRNRKQRFFWEVTAVRADIDPIEVEPRKP
jgi:hypothetical protein